MTSRPLTIAIDARELAGQPTGVGRYLAGVLQTWARNGFPHRLRLHLHAPPPSWISSLPLDLTTHLSPGDVAGTRWEQVTLPAAVRRVGADVLLAPAYTAPLMCPCPTVLIVHDVSFFAQPAEFRWREGLRRRWLTKLSAARASRVLTVSEFSAAEIVRHLGLARSRIALAPQGAPPWQGGPSFEEREPLVLYVGTLFTRRHLPELIVAFAHVSKAVPHARLTLVGGNQTVPEVDPRELARAAGVAERLTWHRWVTDAELERLYASARAFAFLSDYEGFAMTPMEAAAHAVPSVLLDTPVATEVYGESVVRVPLAVPSIAEGLTALLTQPALHGRMVDLGRERIARFTWARTAHAVQEALEGAG